MNRMNRGGGYGPRPYRSDNEGIRPVNVGDELNVKIEAVGEKGDGIAKKDGFVLFVPNTQQGDDVRVRVTKVLRRVGFAEVVGTSEAGSEKESSKKEKAEEIEDTEDFGEEPEEEGSESDDLKEDSKDASDEDFEEESK